MITAMYSDRIETFSRFDTIPERDRQTDGQASRGIAHAMSLCIASRGN